MFTQLSLDQSLLKALTTLGWEKPTQVQQVAIPEILAGADLKVCARTGSGKTAAFLLPVLQQLLQKSAPNTDTRALVLVPTRELARQVADEVTKLTGFNRINSGLLSGGDDPRRQITMLRKNPELLVATPGALLKHLNRGNAALGDLEVLVLDEADRMLDLGLGEEVLEIASRCNPKRQTLLFSATLQQAGIQRICADLLQDPKELLLDDPRKDQNPIRQQVILSDDRDHKEKLLGQLLRREKFAKALVFFNTRAEATQLSQKLSCQKLSVGLLHGEMEQAERNQIMHRFRQGHVEILITTDVAARGLDIEGVELVINYDMARKGDEYLHRIGRTGRAGKEGLAINLVGPYEWDLMVRTERYLHTRFERRQIETLIGRYKGPKKLKSNGKSASSKKKKKNKLAPNQKRGGHKGKAVKSNSPSNKAKRPAAKRVDTGFAPFTKKRSS